jgi:hypothetical protein
LIWTTFADEKKLYDSLLFSELEGSVAVEHFSGEVERLIEVDEALLGEMFGCDCDGFAAGC